MDTLIILNQKWFHVVTIHLSIVKDLRAADAICWQLDVIKLPVENNNMTLSKLFSLT